MGGGCRADDVGGVGIIVEGAGGKVRHLWMRG